MCFSKALPNCAIALLLLLSPLWLRAAEELPRTPESAITPANGNVKRHAQFMERIQDGPVGLLFLGDSITDFWPRRGEMTWFKFAAYNPANFGISGERTEQVLWRITNGELNGITPQVVVIMIGTNNIGRHKDEKPEWAAAGVKKIVDTVREKIPTSKILLLAIFPRGLKTSDERARVDQANKILATFDDGDKIRYLDISSKFLDSSGEIPTDVMPDKLHPSAKGYHIWYEAIESRLLEMMK